MAALATKENFRIDRGTLWLLLVGVFLISFSLLAFEITLTRLLSVMLLYHYVFAVVSLALLGLGAGGIFVYVCRPKMPSEHQRFGTLALFASLISLSIPASVILMAQLGYVEILRDNILVYCLLFSIPFFFAGIFLAEAFRLFGQISAQIYGADLVGAAIGSFGVILLLDRLGGINASFLLGVVASMAALVLAIMMVKKSPKQMIMPAASFLVASVILAANLAGAYLPDIPVIGKNPVKDIHQALYGSALGGKIIDTRWSAFGRTDLVGFSNYPDLMQIYIDGTAGSPMYRFSGDLESLTPAIEGLKTRFTGYFPFLFLSEAERDNALIIGPGGGRDILLTLMGRVGKITAVEVNKDLVGIVHEYAWYNGGIYTNFDNVNVVVDEGRNFLKRQKEKYDIIVLSLPVTQTSRSLEGYALTENFLFTLESINDYLEHLTDEGRLVVVAHDDFTMWKLISVSLAALKERGINNTAAMNQMYIFGLSTPNVYPLFVLKKMPFAPEEVSIMHQRMRQLGYDPLLSYFPYLRESGMVNPVLMALSSGKVAFNDIKKRMAEERGLDISPVSDNNPFFYKIDVGLPPPVSLVLWLSIALMLLVVLVPFGHWQRWFSSRESQAKGKKDSRPTLLRFIVLFAMLGIGFMLIEISLIQKFVLFLGQPVLSLATLLFSLLVGAGLGSLYSSRLTTERISQAIAITSLAVMIVAVSYSILLSFLFHQLLGFNLTFRLFAAVVILIPLGFLMGFPFPLGIRWLRERKMEAHIPWMWGINGIGSVLGSVLTIALAISFGFAQALLVGAGCYFTVFLTFRPQRLKAF